jgi:hypothetical protein
MQFRGRRRFGAGAGALALWQNRALYSTGLGGEIGRRAGLKIPFRKECRFDSDPRHQAFFPSACENRGEESP